MNLEERELYTNILNALENIDIDTLNHEFGICLYLTKQGCFYSFVVRSMFKAWGEYSGDVGFPIPGCNGLSASRQYGKGIDIKNQWDKSTEYGRARWRLVAHCIEYSRAKLQEGEL